jgi:hypothetical protein
LAGFTGSTGFVCSMGLTGWIGCGGSTCFVGSTRFVCSTGFTGSTGL